tara:strand:- start:47 stop:430 length:384 start_codon:yes stop_codon:yes gene_type:complete
MIHGNLPEPEYGLNHEVQSFALLVHMQHLCKEARIEVPEKEIALLSIDQILKLVSQHCGNDPDYIKKNLGIREKIIRLLLIAPSRWIPESELLVRLNQLSDQSISPKQLSLHLDSQNPKIVIKRGST